MMVYLIYFLHLLSFFFFGFWILSATAYHFRGDWATALQRLQISQKELFWSWGLLLMIIMIFGIPYYPWASFHGRKAFYFNELFVWGRSFTLMALAYLSMKYVPKYPALSLTLGFILSQFFAFDWAMSQEGEWFSNLYGLLYLSIGAGLATSYALMTSADYSAEAKRDLVHLLLVVSLMGLYLHFSQFVIIWMGNLPREVIFYTGRLELFGMIPILIFIILKLVPVVIVALTPKLKTNTQALRTVASATMIGLIVEAIWLLRFP